MSSPRYVVARHCSGGIGDHLSCLIGSWWLAKRTNRILVIDWRGSRFNLDPSMKRNCFLDYFEIAHRLGGVDVIADDSVGEISYQTPIWPEKWTPSILSGPVHMKHTAEEVSTANRLVTSSDDPSEPTIVLNQWIAPPPPREAVRTFLADLTPVDSIRSEAQRFWNECIGTSSAIAIHIRHGNGENLGPRSAYWLAPLSLFKQLNANAKNDVHKPGIHGEFLDNMPTSLIGTPSQAAAERRFCRQIGNEFRKLAKAMDMPDAIPFLFSDAAHIVDLIREILPTAVSRPKQLFGQGRGPLHQVAVAELNVAEGFHNGTIPEDVTRDMFVELDLMQRCKGLLYMDSGFSVLARSSLEEEFTSRLKPPLVNRIVSRFVDHLHAKQLSGKR